MTTSTPALVALERARIAFRVHAYEHDPSTSSYGQEAADRLRVDAQRVFKTLVVDFGGSPHVAVLPVHAELDLRALGKRAALAKAADAERVTGYVVGGISPIGQRRRLPTLIDDSALAQDTIFVSAGRRGLEVELAPDDLISVTGARVQRLTRSSE
jgi:Cys-tRNA(Pro)/Cys-tRNA(Cys) deacylase